MQCNERNHNLQSSESIRKKDCGLLDRFQLHNLYNVNVNFDIIFDLMF